MSSNQYRSLKKRLFQVKKHFIPKINPTGSYTERQYDRMRAVRLLVHAEIEAYLEDWAVRITTHAQTQWNMNRKPSKVLMCLLSFDERKFQGIPRKVSDLNAQMNSQSEQAPKFREDIDERVKQVVQYHYRMVTRENHGIKERNLLQMFLPIGLDKQDFIQSQAWISDLDSYGTDRGLVAHVSASSQQPIDPSTESQTIDSLLSGLKVFDEILVKHLDSI